VGLDAQRIKLAQRARNRAVVELAVLARDDLDKQFTADLARGVEQRAQFLLLLLLERLRIVGVVKAQALDTVVDRPFHKLRADVLAELEAERARAGQFDRAAEP